MSSIFYHQADLNMSVFMQVFNRWAAAINNVFICIIMQALVALGIRWLTSLSVELRLNCICAAFFDILGVVGIYC